MYILFETFYQWWMYFVPYAMHKFSHVAHFKTNVFTILGNSLSFPPGVATVVGMGHWTIKAPGYVQARDTVGYTKVSKLWYFYFTVYIINDVTSSIRGNLDYLNGNILIHLHNHKLTRLFVDTASLPQMRMRSYSRI